MKSAQIGTCARVLKLIIPAGSGRVIPLCIQVFGPYPREAGCITAVRWPHNTAVPARVGSPVEYVRVRLLRDRDQMDVALAADLGQGSTRRPWRRRRERFTPGVPVNVRWASSVAPRGRSAHAWKNRTIKKRVVLANEGSDSRRRYKTPLGGYPPCPPTQGRFPLRVLGRTEPAGDRYGRPSLGLPPQERDPFGSKSGPFGPYNRHGPPRIKGKIGVERGLAPRPAHALPSGRPPRPSRRCC
jgi:hypothetical protein